MRIKLIIATVVILIGFFVANWGWQKLGGERDDVPRVHDPDSNMVSKTPGFGQERSGANNSRIPIYITPFYNSEGPQVDVGAHSEELAKATVESIGKVISKLKEELATLPIETMFVASIRLYDLGRKDDAVYWFHSAMYRTRLLRAVLAPDSIGSIGSPAFELIQASSAFHQLAGEYINGYAFGELKKLEETIRLIRSENEQPPRLKTIYPAFDFIAEDLWLTKNSEVSQTLDKLLDYVTNHADEIKAARMLNGIEGKY